MANISSSRLTVAAAQWRAHGAMSALPAEKVQAERTACNLERQAQAGVPTCVCCNKPVGTHAGILKTI